MKCYQCDAEASSVPAAGCWLHGVIVAERIALCLDCYNANAEAFIVWRKADSVRRRRARKASPRMVVQSELGAVLAWSARRR